MYFVLTLQLMKINVNLPKCITQYAAIDTYLGKKKKKKIGSQLESFGDKIWHIKVTYKISGHKPLRSTCEL